MSIRFSIRNTASPAEKEGDTIIRFSGVSETFSRSSERKSSPIGVNVAGETKLLFSTGLDEKAVQFFTWFSDAEKKEIGKQIKNLKPIISDFFGGPSVIDDSNSYFWSDNREVSKLAVTNGTDTLFYDTKNPVHALLYLSIIAGAFDDLVAPTRDWAERLQIPHYLALETEENYEEEENVTRSDAHAALSNLRKDGNPEALFILAWCLQYDTTAFGAYLSSTPTKELVSYHIKYIDGKITSKKKKDMPKNFLKYVELWEGPQTRPLLFVEAYVKAGEYYSFINHREKKYVTAQGTVLGNTIPDAIDTLMKPKNTPDLEWLRDMVEAKWKE